MANLDWVLQGMNAYVDSVGLLGMVEKLQTPKIKKKVEKFRGGGMLAEKAHPMGFEAFEFKFDLSGFHPLAMRQSGLFSRNGVSISFTGAFDGDNNAQHAASFTCTGKFVELDPGSWELGKKNMFASSGNLDKLKLVMDGELIYDIDVDADKYVFGTVDEYAWIRAAL